MKLLNFHKISICLFALCFFNVVSAYSADVLKQHLDLNEVKSTQTLHECAFYFDKLKEATKQTIDELQQEINANNKDAQLSTELYLKRIDELFYDTPQGKLYKKYNSEVLKLTNALEIAQVLDTYVQAVWKATDLLQYRMALEENNKIELKYAVAPYVIHLIFNKYSTEEFGGKILSLREPRNIYNIPSETEKSYMNQLRYANSPILKYVEYEDSAFQMYSLLTAQTSCLKCHGRPSDELDAYNFKKEGYAYNDKLGVVLFSFRLTEKKEAKKEETKKN